MGAIIAVSFPIIVGALAVLMGKINTSLRRWNLYVEFKQSHRYITVSYQIFESMLHILAYEMRPFSYLSSYGIEMIQHTSYYNRAVTLVYGRDWREQEKMNRMLERYLEAKEKAQTRRKELVNDVTTDLLRQVQADIERTIDDNLRAAQEAALKNQEIIDRLSGTNSSRGGSP